MIYVYLQQYLLKVAAEPSSASPPAVARVPLSQPDFLLGALFISFILFAPGGIAGLAHRILGTRRPGDDTAAPVADVVKSPETVPPVL